MHEYTRVGVAVTKIVDVNGPVLDEEGNQTYLDADPVEGVKCLFIWEDNLSSTVEGNVTVRTPTIYTFPDDPITVGDHVLKVSTRSGIVYLEAATVLSIDPVANLGVSPAKIVRLSGAKTV